MVGCPVQSLFCVAQFLDVLQGANFVAAAGWLQS